MRRRGSWVGIRPVHLIITMIKWIRTSRLSIKNSLSRGQDLNEATRQLGGHQLQACLEQLGQTSKRVHHP